MEKDMQEKNEVRTMPEPVTIVPLVDIVENNEGVTLTFEVPGANSESVDIEVLNNIMTMSAKSSLQRNGRPVVFKRNFRLSEDVGEMAVALPGEGTCRSGKLRYNSYGRSGGVPLSERDADCQYACVCTG